MTVATVSLDAPAAAEKTLIRVQAISGLAFGVFLVLHLLNLAVALGGPAAYDAWMAAMRWYYQFPLVEIVAVLGAAIVHMVAGVMRILRRRKRVKAAGRAEAPSWRVRLHRYSGYFLMAAFAGHVAATRAPGLMGMPADFAFLSFSLSALPAFFFPYYVLLAASGCYHLAHGTLAALRVIGVRLPRGITAARSRAFWRAVAAAAVVSLLGVLALGGVWQRPDPRRVEAWRAFANEVVPEAWRPW